VIEEDMVAVALVERMFGGAERGTNEKNILLAELGMIGQLISADVAQGPMKKGVCG
jgi:hypothetical protein